MGDHCPPDSEPAEIILPDGTFLQVCVPQLKTRGTQAERRDLIEQVDEDVQFNYWNCNDYTEMQHQIASYYEEFFR